MMEKGRVVKCMLFPQQIVYADTTYPYSEKKFGYIQDSYH